MLEELNQPVSAAQTEQVSPVSAPVAPTAAPAVKSSVSKPKKFSLKKLAWRVSAAAFWLWWIGTFLLGSSETGKLASSIREALASFLSSVGFTPIHSEYLGTMLKYGWLLTITGFKPVELLGLGVYIVGAPVWLMLYYFFKDLTQDFAASATVKAGLRPVKVRKPAITTIGLLLLGWFLLYGETDSQRPLLAAAFLSGTLFFLLTSRALQRVRPADASIVSRSSWVERTGAATLKTAEDTLSKIGTYKKKSDLGGQRWITRKWEWLFRNLALLQRGQQAKNRLYQLLLADYVASFLVLGAAANLFWAIMAKLSSSFPKPPLQSLLLVCVNYFLPNAGQFLIHYDLPIWARLGPAVTAFILFVLFVGAAASLLPSRFTGYAARLDARYLVTRKVAVQLRQAVILMDKARERLPI